jgi:hypothetical protein
MPTVADTQESHVELKTTEVYLFIRAAITRAQKTDSPQTIFVQEQGEDFGMTITVEPKSNAIATFSEYLTALLCENQSIVGLCEFDPELNFWYGILADQLGVESPVANLVPGMSM